jgi:hypothetical protein
MSRLSKAWTAAEGKKDQDILGGAVSPQPGWPWTTPDEFASRFAEASRWRNHQERTANAIETTLIASAAT